MSNDGRRSFGITLHHDRAVAHELGRRVVARLEDAGVEIRLRRADALAAGLERHAVDDADFAPGLDVAISIGGDGTMLSTVDAVYEADAAVLGINVGQLGYLAEVEPTGLEAALAAILRDEISVSERMMLEVQVRTAGPAAGRWFALNETVLEKVQPGRLVRLAVDINDTYFTTYAADGLILSTPTGSTAYSFSARGPIVSPRLRCAVLTPVSPHMLFDRALVLAPDEAVRVTVQDRPVSLTIDGQMIGELHDGDVVTCTAAARPLRVLTLAAPDFHQILKTKFGLADR